MPARSCSSALRAHHHPLACWRCSITKASMQLWMPATTSECSVGACEQVQSARHGRHSQTPCPPFINSAHCTTWRLHAQPTKLMLLAYRFFEDVMRKNSSSPNKLMESLHLKRFADEGSRQAAAVAEATAAAAAAHAAGRSAFRDGLKNQMATGRHEKATQLQRDEAVHAAILRHQVTKSLHKLC